MSMDRREFMRLAALAAGGAATLAGTGRLLSIPAFADLAASQVRPLPDPKNSGLDHIVVLMMENRSYDSYFWALPGGDGIRDQVFLDVDGTPVATENYGANGRGDFHGCTEEDPHHGWTASRHQYDHGFVADNAPYGKAYYEPSDIPALYGLAAGFTAFDRWFCSVLGPTFPNREYLLSATSGGQKGNCFPVPADAVAEFVGVGGQVCDPTTIGNAQGDVIDLIPESGFEWPCIFDRLDDAGVDWRVYHHDLAGSWLFGERIVASGKVFPFAQYAIDAALGNLPAFVFIEPGYDNAYTGIGNDDHWPHDIRLGQQLISDVATPLFESSAWPNSALVITYDEHGGFFDHVLPPRTRDDRANRADRDNDYGQLGFRVPTVVASPFARRGFVAHPTYDHTSILKMVEWRFGLAPLTVRDAAARNMAETFDWEHPDTSIPDTFEPYDADILVGPICPGGQPLFPETIELPGLPVPVASSPATIAQARAAGHRAFAPHPDRDHDLSRLFEAGFIERLGYRLPFETGREMPTKIRRFG